MPQPCIFVSHSHHDNEWCHALVAALRQHGYDTWYDEAGLQAGDEWYSRIGNELQERDVFVVVLSPEAWAANWVRREIALAEATGRRIIPVMHQPTTVTGFLLTLQYIDAAGMGGTAAADKVSAIVAHQPTSLATHTQKAKATPKKSVALSPTHRAIRDYYTTLEQLRQQGVTNEMGLRRAFEALLTALGREAGWTLVAEVSLTDRRARPDATLQNDYSYPTGYWEAKDLRDNLDVEIRTKIAVGYPTTNIIFENTRRAVLYQGGKVKLDLDITQPHNLVDLLTAFFAYVEPEYGKFEVAIEQFKDRVPELALGLIEKIRLERKAKNTAFTRAFEQFREVCRAAIDPNIRDEAIDEMLVQHLLTERLFRTVFNDADFTRKNVIANEIERVITALVSRNFSRNEFQGSLDRFYLAIENAARDVKDYSEKQHFLNVIYERFFQGFAKEQADTFGIVYTPQPIVDFMCASVEEVLRREFHVSLADRGVQILDPATGTGNFITNLIRRMADSPNLDYKYANDLFCNEIMLLPYYIASMNIEHEYYALRQRYAPFEGICFVDTLTLEQGQQGRMFTEKNTERVQKENDATLMVIIGNPPYNMGQKNENENNQNRSYRKKEKHHPDGVDDRIQATYVKDSRATLNNKLYDPYVKFFRWAADRLRGRDGIVCYVSNNSFVDQIAFDGMRRHLLQDFTQIWHLDLHGNVRKNPKLSGTTHNVFGIQVGVGITVAVKASQNPAKGLWYHRVDEDWRKVDKLSYIKEKENITNISWQELEPDESSNWLTEGMRPEFANFLSIGSKEAKLSRTVELPTIFRLYSLGVATNRDSHVYAFNRDELQQRVGRFIEIYNTAVDKLKRGGQFNIVDSLVDIEDGNIKWTRQVKASLMKFIYSNYNGDYMRSALYRPFAKKNLYFDDFWNEEQYQLPLVFPTLVNAMENEVISVTGIGSEKPFMALTSHDVVDLHLVGAGSGTQCFPLYTYAEDGTNRRENITDWALAQFRAAYGDGVSKRDIFHYVYAVLHHPAYRERYAENLKRALPRIPLAPKEAFATLAAAGARLAAIHTGYEQMPEYPLTRTVTGQPFNYRVTKMSLTRDHDAIIYNDTLRLEGIPPAALAYRLGNRSALEWVIDQYRVTTDNRSGITSDPNRDDDEQYITRLVGQVIAVSLETQQIVGALPDLGLPTAEG